MGVTIHYKGRFNKKKSLAKMIEEAKDIAEINNWEYHLFETKFPDAATGSAKPNRNWYGIHITPPKCESISLYVDSNGYLPEPTYTKTQFAGASTHIIVVNLLRYFSEKYFLNFEVDDEGDYWQTNDRTLLEKQISTVGSMIKTMKEAFDNTPKEKGEQVLPYVLRVVDKATKNYTKPPKK